MDCSQEAWPGFALIRDGGRACTHQDRDFTSISALQTAVLTECASGQSERESLAETPASSACRDGVVVMMGGGAM